ncbi:MAG: hypothetical protein B7733_24870 [Myxococcales bacterium FL481]|nr:MAG: hypothetical protein B7733_24870 [Myxococcales bacterium FL481]
MAEQLNNWRAANGNGTSRPFGDALRHDSLPVPLESRTAASNRRSICLPLWRPTMMPMHSPFSSTCSPVFPSSTATDQRLRSSWRRFAPALGFAAASWAIAWSAFPSSAHAGVVQQISAGTEHTCALVDTGDVHCWGRGGRGRLGYGNESDIGDDEPAAAAGAIAVGGLATQVDSCWLHTCALLDGGAVRCWGAGTDGRLGHRGELDIGDDEFPELFGDVEVGEPAAAIATGRRHTCVLLTTGDVRCWGYGGDGALGYASTDNVGVVLPPSAAGDIDVGGQVRAIAAGARHTCALLDAGTVRCWGEGEWGKLGYGTTDAIGDDEAPAAAGDVEVGEPVEQVVAGEDHTCALLESGNVRCWGRGDHGRLGYGDEAHIGDDELPSDAGNVDVGGEVIRLAAGHEHTCAVLSTGAVRCWGRSAHGKLGYGGENDIGDDEAPATAGDVNIGDGVVEVAAGEDHTCAILNSGQARCWGRGSFGRLGYGSTLRVTEPSVAGDVPLFATPTPVGAFALSALGLGLVVVGARRSRH